MLQSGTTLSAFMLCVRLRTLLYDSEQGRHRADSVSPAGAGTRFYV